MIVETDLWVENNQLTPTVCKEHLDKYKHYLKWNENESILDCGVADGNVTRHILYPVLPKDYKELLLADISPPMVEYVKKNVRLPNSQAHIFDVACNDIPEDYENRFDHVFGFFLLHMLKKPRQAIKNIFKMLKPGGQTFLNSFRTTPLDEVFDFMHKQPKWEKYGLITSPYYNLLNPVEQYKKDFEEAGFKNILIGIEDGEYIFSNEDVMKNFFLAVNSALPKIPKEEKEEYKSCYLDACRRGRHISFGDGNSKPKYFCEMCVFIATKPL